MRHSWEQRIHRAVELLEQRPDSEILRFYRELLGVQQEIASAPAPRAEGAQDSDGLVQDALDMDTALRWMPQLLEALQKHGPAKLSEQAKQLRASTKERQRESLIAGVLGVDDSGQAFLGRMLLQPLLERLARESTRRGEHTGTVCPACGSKPQLAVLYPEGDGGKRYLMCSLCFTEWEFRRVLCPACSETEYIRLPRYTPDEPLAVRVEACETCKQYLKSFDMTLNGLMIPEVDEVGTVALDVWAADQGYRKIRLNVTGF